MHDGRSPFASIVSHDLSEPLRAITSFTTLLAQRYHGKLDAAADEYLAFVTNAARRTQQMLADLLAYRHLGAAVPTATPVDCETLLTEVLADLRMAIEESHAMITHDSLPTVPGDATRLKHVFQNLLSNALKFRHPAVPPRVHLAAWRTEGGWEFAVRDHGIGLAPAQAECIFEVFQRLHTSHEYPGTGMGLAICKRIIEQHGGCIWVESQPGQGPPFFHDRENDTAAHAARARRAYARASALCTRRSSVITALRSTSLRSAGDPLPRKA